MLARGQQHHLIAGFEFLAKINLFIDSAEVGSGGGVLERRYVLPIGHYLQVNQSKPSSSDAEQTNLSRHVVQRIERVMNVGKEYLGDLQI